MTEAHSTGVSGVAWRAMNTAPLDGTHCILAVPEPDGIFVYSVQGAYQDGQWNAVHRMNVKPLYWMPNLLLPEGWQGLLPKAESSHV
jgi:hypothetical protein